MTVPAGLDNNLAQKPLQAKNVNLFSNNTTMVMNDLVLA